MSTKDSNRTLMAHLITILFLSFTLLLSGCRWGNLETFDSAFRSDHHAALSLSSSLRPLVAQAQSLTWQKGGGLGDDDLALESDGSVVYIDRGHLAFVVSDQTFSGNFTLEYEVPNTLAFETASQVGIMLASTEFPPRAHFESAYFHHNQRGQHNACFGWTQANGWLEVPVTTGDRLRIQHENGTVKLYKNFTPGAEPLETRTVGIFQTAQLKVFAKFVPDRLKRPELLVRPRLTLN